MRVKIFWKWEKTQELLDKVNNSLEELWLSDFMEVEVTDSDEIKNSLWITKEPALIIEEEAIDFRDTIFEGIIPNEQEIKSMFISIIWWWDWWSCSSSGWCWSCSTGCC